ncbi:MAG: ABC transporter ATP-binding protein [Candidatus Nanopelagicales bacterium]|nr:ABC transporter ATP-binding protein [Candidatus Nanopelagicales bacterium]MDZ4249738.1 ABC transporter ATP-binding protein [Candidatus Nanopelagicales bacterium]
MVRSLRRILVLYRPYLGRLILSQVSLLLSALCAISVAGLTSTMINEGLLAKDTSVITDTGIWMGVLAVLSGVFMAITAALAVVFAHGTGYAMRTMAYDQIQTFSFGNFDRFRTGNLLVRLSSDVLNVQNAVLYAILLILYAPFMVIIAFVLALLTTPGLVWILVAAAVMVLAVMAVIAPRIDRAYIERQERLDAVNNALQENLSGVRVVKSFVREDLESEQFAERADALRTPAFRAAFNVALLTPLLNVFSQVGIAVALWVGGQSVLEDHGLTVGQVSAFMQYLTLVVVPLALMAIVIPFILRGDASARRIYEIIDARSTLSDDGKLKPGTIAGRICFENVTFAFDRADGEPNPAVLHDINLVLEPGERVGILGATGSGKSALVNLIPRFYDVSAGKVTIDGVDVRDIPLDQLRAIVGVTLQEAVLFQGDIRTNLKFGAPDSGDEVMEQAAKAADAYGFVMNVPEQWDGEVSRRGYNFSGGQRQRLSMARTLVPRPSVLILDDSTSALDVATEGRVQAAIPEFAAGVTTIYVAQRISAVIDLDRVVLMDAGMIVDVGSHEELLERSGLYQQIYESQLGSDVTRGAIS